MSHELIYLASPYTHEDPDVVEKRVFDTEAKFVELFNLGKFVFAPTLYCHAVSKTYALGGSYKIWRPFCLEMLRRCDKLCVLQLDGWDSSVGVLNEIRLARELHKIISYC